MTSASRSAFTVFFTTSTRRPRVSGTSCSVSGWTSGMRRPRSAGSLASECAPRRLDRARTGREPNGRLNSHSPVGRPGHFVVVGRAGGFPASPPAGGVGRDDLRPAAQVPVLDAGRRAHRAGELTHQASAETSSSGMLADEHASRPARGDVVLSHGDDASSECRVRDQLGSVGDEQVHVRGGVAVGRVKGPGPVAVEVLAVEERPELLEVGAAQIVMSYDFDVLVHDPNLGRRPPAGSRPGRLSGWDPLPIRC